MRLRELHKSAIKQFNETLRCNTEKYGVLKLVVWNVKNNQRQKYDLYIKIVFRNSSLGSIFGPNSQKDRINE